ncbi:jg25387 [Pararge aegeria aegeria]|uniref:Jg25387 protein n=1 Tax=Pararge aegeria aegeria TaxID=348720 RepID=A0A8S4S386_9NEOP|nr:jg25387 [Pararge aegeria aegeria]
MLSNINTASPQTRRRESASGEALMTSSHRAAPSPPTTLQMTFACISSCIARHCCERLAAARAPQMRLTCDPSCTLLYRAANMLLI